MSASTPYQVKIPQERLDHFRQRLALTTFPDELDASGWDYGAPLADIKRLVKYWRESYDWRRQEEQINRLPQFVTEIPVDEFETLKIHYVHRKSDVNGAIPLLFVHGWPGSFVEVTKILEPLTQPSDRGPAFHVVAPSLPNFGFSEGTSKRGFGLAQYAEVCHKLMIRLGYDEYVTQGGDWGSHISRCIDKHHHGSCKATHLNMIVPSPPTLAGSPLLVLQHAVTPYTTQERAGLDRTQWFAREGRGYSAEQGTKPQTLGYALHDSPVGLLAWIYEKMHDWTDGYPWTDDEILTWVSIYAFSTAGPAASLRIYYEAVHAENHPPGSSAAATKPFARTEVKAYNPHVPLGCSLFPRDLDVPPLAWAQTLGRVVFAKAHDRGGHFAAYETPDLLVGDVREMFGKGGGAYGVVKGKDGYGGGSGASRL